MKDRKPKLKKMWVEDCINTERPHVLIRVNFDNGRMYGAQITHPFDKNDVVFALIGLVRMIDSDPLLNGKTEQDSTD